MIKFNQITFENHNQQNKVMKKVEFFCMKIFIYFLVSSHQDIITREYHMRVKFAGVISIF